MAKTQFNVEQIKTEAAKASYAVAGATELAVEFARGYAAEAQKAAQDRLNGVQARVQKVDLEPRNLQHKARIAVNARVEDLQEQARDAQVRFEARIKDLQADAKELPVTLESKLADAIEELNSTYADLARRGEKFVAAIKKDGVRAVANVKPARKAAAKKAAAKKAPARKSTARKTTTAKKATKKTA